MRWALVFLAAAACSPAASFEEFEEYESPDLSCGAGFVFLGSVDDGHCLQVSGSLIQGIAADSQIGSIPYFNDYLRVGVVVDDASGTGAAIGGRLRTEYTIDWNLGVPITHVPSVTEAFVQRGNVLQFRGGLFDAERSSLVDSQPPETFTPLGLAATSTSTGPIGGLGAQLLASTFDGLKLSAGIEALENAQRGTLIVAATYDHGGNEASFTATRAGLLGGPELWSLNASARHESEWFDLMVYAGAGMREGHVAGTSVRIGSSNSFAAGTLSLENNDPSLSGLIRLGDEDVGPAVTLAGTRMWGPSFDYSLIELSGSVLLGNDARLKATVGHASSSDIGAIPFTYAKGSLEWWVHSATLATFDGYANDLGAWKGLARVEHRVD